MSRSILTSIIWCRYLSIFATDLAVGDRTIRRGQFVAGQFVTGQFVAGQFVADNSSRTTRRGQLVAKCDIEFIDTIEDL